MSIRVSIIEDSDATRESLRAVIDRTRGLSCVGAYANGEEAFKKLCVGTTDVFLVDLNLPGMSGIECVARLKETAPKVQILILTTYDEDELIFESLRAGANGFLLKNMPPAELMQAIVQVHDGGSPMSMRIARKVVRCFQEGGQRSKLPALTSREQEILTLLAKGYLYKEIADRLGITLSTVRAHLHAIYEKLHVHSRTQAVIKYLGGRPI